jgi:hypothetical protein
MTEQQGGQSLPGANPQAQELAAAEQGADIEAAEVAADITAAGAGDSSLMADAAQVDTDEAALAAATAAVTAQEDN